MADHTITLTDIEEKVLASYWPSVEDALRSIIDRQLAVRGRELIYQSSSALDPRKLDKADLTTELDKVKAEIKTYTEKNPETIEPEPK